jgi:hypothetical protein
VIAAAAVLDISQGPIGPKFRCVLPGHDERRPSANLWRAPSGAVVYRCHHASKHDTPGTFTLAQVHAAQVAGRVFAMNGPEHGVWKRRLLVETGFYVSTLVDVPDAPDDLPPLERKLYDGFTRLLSVREAQPDGASAEGRSVTPAPYTRKFAARWCGVGDNSRVSQALKELVRRGLIHVAGETTTARGKPLLEFLPGPRPANHPPARLTRQKTNQRHYLSWGGLTERPAVALASNAITTGGAP